jgi:hypothetical protein
MWIFGFGTYSKLLTASCNSQEFSLSSTEQKSIINSLVQYLR